MDARVVDFGSEFARWDVLARAGRPTDAVRAGLARDTVLPPAALLAAPASSVPAQLAHAIYNKSKQPIYSVLWTPSGRRLLAGAANGEFSLWHGMGFGFEMVMQAHENDVRCMRYSHSGEWLLSGDQDGVLKVWQPNFNNVKRQQVHAEVVRDVAWSPSDSKFATASDDGSVKIWSFATMAEEACFQGRGAHGWDVKCVDWHPSLALLATGSKDNTVRLWDPRQRECVSVIHEFKNTVTRVKFQPTGARQLFAAASRANTAHVFDLRAFAQGRASQVLRGHPADVSCLQWHPVHPQLLSTGTHEGSVHHFLLDSSAYKDELGYMTPAWSIPKAHQWPVWDMAYHPVGHMLATASNDRSVKVWARTMPGDDAQAVRAPTVYAEPEQPERHTPPAEKRKELRIPGL